MISELNLSTIVIYVVDKMSMLSQQYNKYIDVFFKENVDKLLFH